MKLIGLTCRDLAAATYKPAFDVATLIFQMASKGWLREGVIKGKPGGGLDYDRDYSLTFTEVVLFCAHCGLDEMRVKRVAEMLEARQRDALSAELERRRRTGPDQKAQQIVLAKRVRLALVNSGLFDETGNRQGPGLRVRDGVVLFAPALGPAADAARAAGVTTREINDVLAGLPGGMRVGPKKFKGKLGRAVSISEAELLHFIETAASW